MTSSFGARPWRYFRHALFAGVAFCVLSVANLAHADLPDTVARVKNSIAIIGIYSPTNSPPFALRGSGFVVGDGNLAVTNVHVLGAPENAGNEGSGSNLPAALVVQIRRADGEWQPRRATVLRADPTHDLALLRFEGPAVPALTIRDSSSAREGQSIAFMGFPIGGALGYSPVTHHGIIASITPIVLPAANARQLNDTAIRRAKEGRFNIFQLDATAYPGNSGGPLFDPESGEVLGVVNMAFVKGSKESALTHPSGISYAIPSRFLLDLIGNTR